MSSPRFLPSILVFFFLVSSPSSLFLPVANGKVGITISGDNFVHLDKNCSVVQYLKDRGVMRFRINRPSSVDIAKFYDSGISLSLAFRNHFDLDILTNSTENARTWLRDLGINLNATKRVTITDISIGFNVTTTEENYYFSEAVDTINAMKNLRKALDSVGLHGISVTTEHTFDIIVNSTIPTRAEFYPALTMHLKEQLELLREWKSPFQIELYPYLWFAKGTCNIQFALFEAEHDGPLTRIDPESRRSYNNAFELMLDSVYVALLKLGFGGMEMQVVATGWTTPTLEETKRVGASRLNAAEYYSRVVRWLNVARGTPLKPRWAPRTYLHSLLDDPHNFDEHDYNRNMGISFLGDKSKCFTPRFEIHLDNKYVW